MFSPGALLSRNGHGALPSDTARYETALDDKDHTWKFIETSRKFVLLVDDCFPLWMSDPDDTSSMGDATEDFWARHGDRLNVEASLMKQDEHPWTDKGKFVHEDRVFGNTGSAQDPVLRDHDYTTLAITFDTLAIQVVGHYRQRRAAHLRLA